VSNSDRIKAWDEPKYLSQYKNRGHPSLSWNYGTTSFSDTGSMFGRTNPGPPYRSGGNWLLSKVDYDIRGFFANKYYGTILPANLIFSGKVFGRVTNFNPIANPGSASDADMVSYGTTAIARTEPTNPNVSLAVGLAELKREGMPALIGHESWKKRTLEAKKASKNGSGEYLNYQFGWAPLVSDVKGFADSVIRSDELIEQYRAGSDKPIHRRYDTPMATTLNSKTGQAVPVPSVFNQFGTGAATSTLSTRQWFEGQFRYHVPVGSNQLDKLKEHASYARKLYGIELTPEVLWNLAPWSWANDWFMNTGDIMHNVSALGRDGLVLQYGFTMSSAILVERHLTNFTYNGGFGQSSYVRTSTYKKRLTASPFGFGLSDGDLSNRQKAIIVALGVQTGGSKI